ncbi:MAG: sulfite exporter TauE/SafE family protein [Fimbriimonadales bacterium]
MPTDWMLFAEICLLACLAGAFGSMVGLGGGLLLVPALITAFHVPDGHARFAGLVAVCVTSLSGSIVYIRQGVTDMRAAGLLQLPTTVGAICGALVGERINENILRSLFAALLVYTAWKMLRTRQQKEAEEPTPSRMAGAITACVFGGVVSALLGVGGGVVFAPVLSMIMNKPQRVASATSTYLIALTAAGSGLIYAKNIPESAIASVVIPGAIGIFFGAQIGAYLSGIVSGLWLKRILAVGVVGTAASLIVKVVNSIG